MKAEVYIIYTYILLSKKINTFWFKSIDKFWSEGTRTVLAQKIQTGKADKFHKDF